MYWVTVPWRAMSRRFCLCGFHMKYNSNWVDCRMIWHRRSRPSQEKLQKHSHQQITRRFTREENSSPPWRAGERWGQSLCGKTGAQSSFSKVVANCCRIFRRFRPRPSSAVQRAVSGGHEGASDKSVVSALWPACNIPLPGDFLWGELLLTPSSGTPVQGSWLLTSILMFHTCARDQCWRRRNAL